MCPLDDLNRIDGRWFHLGVKHNKPVERHLPVFNHRRDSRQKQPLLGRIKTIPAREIQAFTGTLYVSLDNPRGWRNIAIPRPTRLLRMAVGAGMSKYIDD